jgi:hypothetical protein
VTGIYRKRGRVVRYEHGHVIRSVESGEAVDDGQLFRAYPVSAPPLSEFQSECAGVVAQIESLIEAPLAIERLIVSHGIAEHECGDIRWSEETKRIHVAIAHRSLRVLIDLADFDLGDVRRAVDVLSRVTAERAAPQRVRLAPNVAAALLPSLVGTDVVELWQSSAEHDGKGLPVIEQRLTSAPWPNWFRPSYRTRPLRMPLHLRAVAASDNINYSAPEAVALLAPVAGNVMHVLCVDGEDVFPATIVVERVLAARATNQWYPYGGGSFGAEMLV